MIPLKLRLQGFLSYHQAVELDFSSFDLACISGANGAGKSSLLDAITWALFGRARKANDDALINSSADMAEVTFEFEYENDRYRVQRSKVRNKTTLLEFQIANREGEWVPLSEHSVRETEKRIERTLRMEYDTFINTSFFLQGKADQFAQQPAGKRKEILSNILGLEAWESYRETATNRRRTIEVDMSGIDAWLVEVETELNQENERITRLAELLRELEQKVTLRKEKEALFESLRKQADAVREQQKMVELLTAQLEETRRQQAQTSAQLTERENENQTYETILEEEQEINAAFKKLVDLRRELERQNQLALQFHQFEQQRVQHANQIAIERTRLEGERDHLNDAKNQVGLLKKGLKETESKLGQSTSQCTMLQTQWASKANDEEKYHALQKAQAELASENKRLKLVMDELKARIDHLKSSTESACPLCGQPLTVQHRREMLAELETQGKTLGDQYRKNIDDHKENEKQIKEITDVLNSYSALEKELQNAQKVLAGWQAEIQHAQSEINAWHAGKETRLKEVENLLATEQYALDDYQGLKNVQESIAGLKYDPSEHEGLRQKEQADRANEERYRNLEKARATVLPLQREIENLKQRQNELQGKIGEQQSIVSAAQEKLDQQALNLPDLSRIEMELNSLRDEENLLRLQVGAAQQLVDVLTAQKQHKQELQTRRVEMAQQITRLEKLERAFGKNGVPALLIEQTLPDIEGKANQILDRLSAGSMSLKIETQRERKTKKDESAIQTLDLLISDATGVREYELFSGGEAFRINFAIRLALAHALAKRAGARLQTLVIDEGFGSQDADGRQRVIEAINMVMENESQAGAGESVSDIRKILVITHLDELKDAFPARIEVEKTPDGSKVQVIS